MNSAENASARNRWPLARVLILILAGGFPGLMMDIRVEHVEAVREYSVAWLPIIYCGLMTIACSIALRFWNKTARFIMLPLFVIAFAIGGLGFYFHNQGDLKKVIRSSVHAWTDPHMNRSDGPPQVAPLAFAGLGAIGILASLKRFNA
jgi:hypothetical protein